MATRKPRTTKPAPTRKGVPTVDEFFTTLDHPLKDALQEVRAVILGVRPDIAEGIKWNAPSFRVDEFFATASIRNNAVMVILHQGAKVRDNTSELDVRDPDGLLVWHAKDRCSVTFRDMDDVAAKRAAFADVVRQWVALM